MGEAWGGTTAPGPVCVLGRWRLRGGGGMPSPPSALAAAPSLEADGLLRADAGDPCGWEDCAVESAPVAGCHRSSGALIFRGAATGRAGCADCTGREEDASGACAGAARTTSPEGGLPDGVGAPSTRYNVLSVADPNLNACS